MKRIIPMIMSVALSAGFMFQSCQDTPDTVGGALVPDRIAVVVDSSFTLDGRSVVNTKVQSRTTTQLLGAIKAKNYGVLSSDYVTQMFPSNAIDTVGIDVNHLDQYIDSVKLLLIFDKGGFIGDSIAPLGIQVYELDKSLPYPIYSNESPEGYYDPSRMLGNAAYTASGIGINDTIAGYGYRYIYVPLPREMGYDVFRKFKQDPPLFSDPQRFASEFFKGFYVKSSFGSGRVTRITYTRWVMYYHRTERIANSQGVEVDSVRNYASVYMASAPEVVANSHIQLSLDASVEQMVADGHKLIVSPAGRDVEIDFPAGEILSAYHDEAGDRSVINSLIMSIPGREVDNDKGIGMPKNLLMVLSSKKDDFFAQNKLPDDVTSFYGVYNTTDSVYEFSNMRSYLVDLLQKEELKPEDYVFTLTPISLETESSSNYTSGSSTQINAITPMVSLPSMVDMKLGDAKIKLTFSRQNVK